MDVPGPPRELDLEAVYRQHRSLVCWIVRASGVPESSVDDVTQDVFVAIDRRRGAFRRDDLRKWIVGVTRSVCHAHRRSHARARRRLAKLPAPIPPRTPEERASERQALRRLQRALDALAPEQREVFVHVELEGLTAPETAARVGAKVATVSSRLRLARRRVGESLGLDLHALPENDASDSTRARRGWAAIAARVAAEPLVPVVPLGTAATTGGWLGGAAIGGVIGAALVGAWVLAARPQSSGAATPTATTAARPSPSRPPRSDPAVDVAAETPAPPVGEAVDPASAPPRAADRPRPRKAAPVAALPPRATVLDAPAPAVVEPEPATPAPVDALAVEAEILRVAARALADGDDAAAKRELDAHARRFPDGALATERERLRRQLAD